jgi:hypothetical protein
MKMKKAISYKIGDRFKYSSDIYLLCQTGNSMVSLVDLECGNRWEDAIHVEDINDITKEEFNKIMAGGDGFIKVKGKRK